MTDNQKQEIRERIKGLKGKFSFEEKKKKSELIFLRLIEKDFFKNSKTVMAYWSLNDEVFTHDFILEWCNRKTIVLPVVDGDKLKLRIYSGIESMKKGESYGIMEPIGPDFKDIEKIDLIITPGVAFDRQNNRLGRGKAYYDKLLKLTKAVKVGVCFDFQLLESVPVDIHDIKMDYVIFNSSND